MPHGGAFEQLLNEQLSAAPGVVHAAIPPGPSGTAAAYGLFIFDAVTGRAAVAASSAHAVFQHRAGHDAVAPGAGSVASPTRAQRIRYDAAPASGNEQRRGSPPASGRALTARERAALDELVALGATLSADPSMRELRSAFRTLARRYHPDRHVGLTDAERAGVAQLFARAHDAYRVLAHGTR